MKPHILAISLLWGFITFGSPAVSSPQDCSPSIVAMIKPHLIEAPDFGDAFGLLDAGDCVAALDRFERAADRGNLAAQNNAGVIYESGLGVHADLERARQWYRKAAEGGLSEAQWNLAAIVLSPHSSVNLFDAFLPIPKPETPHEIARYREALMWSIAAAENGHPVASEGVRRLSDTLQENDISTARREARKWIFSQLHPTSAGGIEASSNLHKAKAVAELARVQDQVQAMIPNLITLYVNLIQQSLEVANPDFRNNKRWQKYLGRLRAIMEEEMMLNTGGFVERMTLIYADAFSDEELDELVDMLQAPAMQKMLDRMPELMIAGQTAGEEWGREVAEAAIQKLMDEYNLTSGGE